MITLDGNLPPIAPATAAPRAAIVRNFTPNWFTVTMGTGVLALALDRFPVAVPGMTGLAVGLWLANIGLFTLFGLLYAAHWLMFFDEARRIFDHPVMSMFCGAIPMGLATIINGFVAFGPAVIGPAALSIAWGLWWIDVAMAVACGLAIPYFMFTRQGHSMARLTAVWLLPVVAAEVAAVSGGLLVPHLAPAQGFAVLIFCYVLWAWSVPLALAILALLFLRLALHKLPERAMGVTAWLALGPIGTGALGLLVLGAAAPDAFAAAGLPAVGKTAFGLGLLGGVVLWGYASWWLALAVLKTIHYLGEGLPFNLGWWGFTFPLGVFALATLALGQATGLDAFAATGAVLVLCLAALWAIVAARTVAAVARRSRFAGPGLRPA